jgi:hypothetical protein
MADLTSLDIELATMSRILDTSRQSLDVAFVSPLAIIESLSFVRPRGTVRSPIPARYRDSRQGWFSLAGCQS